MSYRYSRIAWIVSAALLGAVVLPAQQSRRVTIQDLRLISELPPCTGLRLGQIIMAKDALDYTDCSSGGGVELAYCMCDGTEWMTLQDYLGGGGFTLPYSASYDGDTESAFRIAQTASLSCAGVSVSRLEVAPGEASLSGQCSAQQASIFVRAQGPDPPSVALEAGISSSIIVSTSSLLLDGPGLDDARTPGGCFRAGAMRYCGRGSERPYDCSSDPVAGLYFNTADSGLCLCDGSASNPWSPLGHSGTHCNDSIDF